MAGETAAHAAGAPALGAPVTLAAPSLPALPGGEHAVPALAGRFMGWLQAGLAQRRDQLQPGPGRGAFRGRGHADRQSPCFRRVHRALRRPGRGRARRRSPSARASTASRGRSPRPAGRCRCSLPNGARGNIHKYHTVKRGQRGAAARRRAGGRAGALRRPGAAGQSRCWCAGRRAGRIRAPHAALSGRQSAAPAGGSDRRGGLRRERGDAVGAPRVGRAARPLAGPRGSGLALWGAWRFCRRGAPAALSAGAAQAAALCARQQPHPGVPDRACSWAAASSGKRATSHAWRRRASRRTRAFAKPTRAYRRMRSLERACERHGWRACARCWRPIRL